MKIGVGIIAKNEQDSILALLESVSWADEICVVDTGSTDGTESVVMEFAKKHSPYLKYIKTMKHSNSDGEIMDFAGARNEYVLWLDNRVDFIFTLSCGNIIKDPHLVRGKICGEYNLYGCTVTRGGSSFIHHRIFRTGVGIRYFGRVHEIPMAPSSVGSLTKQIDVVISHEAGTGQNQESYIKRNLRLTRAMFDDRQSPRNAFYLANALKDSGAFKEAIEAYTFYLGIADWLDERMFARLYLMRCMVKVGDVRGAIACGWKALSECDRYAEITYEMAKIYFNEGDYNMATGFCFLCLHEPPDSLLFIEKDKYTSAPLALIERIENEKRKSRAGVKPSSPPLQS